MPCKAAMDLTFVRFLMSINQANQWWFPLRNTGFHITGIWVSWDKNIHYWNELSSFFNTYEPWQYKFRLNKILTEINDIVTDGKYMIRNSPKDFAEISQRLEICIDLFEDCERNYKKEILLRVVTNKAVQIFLLLFVALIILLIIAA